MNYFKNLKKKINDKTLTICIIGVGYVGLGLLKEYSKKGYNIVVGKLSFEISKILDPNGITPTLLATDMDRLAVIDTHKLRNLTINECKKLFGFPKNYKVNLNQRKAYNLFGESIAIPVVEKVAEQVLQDLE